jgi:hypothetical protein
MSNLALQWNDEYIRYDRAIPRLNTPISTRHARECIAAGARIWQETRHMRQPSAEIDGEMAVLDYKVKQMEAEIEMCKLRVTYYIYLSNHEFEKLRQGDTFMYVKSAFDNWNLEKSKLQKLEDEFRDLYLQKELGQLHTQNDESGLFYMQDNMSNFHM